MIVEYLAHPPGDPKLVDDPYGGGPLWVVTRHEDVTTVLADRRFVANPGSLPGGTDVYADMMAKLGIHEELIPYLAGDMVHLDPPVHTRLRRFVSRSFSARRIASMRPRVQVHTDAVLDGLAGHAVDGKVDMVEHFAYPMPVAVICELLGVPVEDWPKWRAWTRDLVSMDPRRMNVMLADMAEYILDLCERRRAEPADDLVTELLQGDKNNDRLTETELVTMVMILVMAGQTTISLLGNGLMALLTHPDQRAMLREDPALMPRAVQELLRYCGPAIVSMVRYASEDMTVGGKLIKQGDRVQPVLSSANHDPLRYAEPGTLDFGRDQDAAGLQHMAYSHGAHYCLGGPLANHEAEVAFHSIFARYPNMELAVPVEDLKWKKHQITRELVRLPVTLGAPA